MADSYTEGLRRAAPQWSLAGDKQLLDVLQGLHQKIIQKCQETNRNLENMVSTLDEASIHLQNVNNKFTALSNSQFIESRVFDDDNEDLTENEKPKIETESKPDEMSSIKQSLQILDSLHESVTIMCDSDSESGTDDDEDITRVVLKPKDLYVDRPLPYIIGSKLWKSKWHAGLIADDSDSVSSGSMKRDDNLEQYSDSDEPRTESPRHSPRHSSQLSLSSELESEQLPQSISIPKPTVFPRDPRSQSDVAAELARRLGAAEHKLPAPEPIPEAPSPTVRKLYKPDRPTPGTVFLDEPPPLDSDQSEESDGDIFAELHKKQPYTHANKVESSVADDLFGRPVFNESPPPENPPAKQKHTLFEDEPEPELFADKPKTAPEPRKEDDTGIKKPIGGKSLFGSNATAESIGAAILKRNQRQPSTSGEESDQEPPQIIKKVNEPKNKVIEENIREKQKDNEVRSQKEKERDIFDDLFAKSERINKEKNKNKVVEQKKEPPKPVKKADLFSDNIFDDIDDIFTTNIKVVTKDEKKAQKSIFDEDDDLFSNVSKNVHNNIIKQIESKNTKDLYDDNNDDDIFRNKPTEPKKVSKDFKENSIKETKSIFDDSDDDLFADVDKNKTTKNVTMSVNVTKNETVSNLLSSTETRNSEKGLFSDDDDLFKDENSERESQSIKENFTATKRTENKLNLDTSTKQPSKIIKSPDLFEDDDDDRLFLFQSQNKTASKEKTESKTKNVNILPEKLERDIKTSDFKLKKSEDVISEIKPAISVFGDEVTSDDLFSKPAKTNKDDSSTFTDSEASNNINKSDVVGAIDSFIDDNIVVTKCDKTIDTTVTVARPNISEKPVITKVAVINTQVKPSTESLSPQDITANDTTAIDTRVTNVPEITNKTDTSANITVNESEVIVRPNILQKPSTTKLNCDSEQSLSKNTNLLDLVDNTKEFDADKNVTDSIFDDFKTDNKPPIETKDVFSDIFNDQPPVFEKPKEPKKSKNVNALFDDDSDDESLFFKKNDVITDERPEGFVSTDDRLFGLFRDEPPAIDVDFVQKPNKSDRFSKENVSQNIHGHTSSQEVEKIISKPDVTDGKVDKPADNILGNKKKSDQKQNMQSDDIFASSNTSKPPSVKNVKLYDDSDENSNKEGLFSNVTGDIFKKLSAQDDVDIFSSPTTDEDPKLLSSKFKTEITYQDKTVPESTNKDKVDAKKIGKLKPTGLNINVNSLLPGALPKKTVKTSDKTDGQVPSKSTEELSYSDSAKDNEFEAKLVKSISFEGNPGSPVLDNKLSKERAKIQVKRRPSTRRARREAVKKSGIDFGEDSTDNSSSIDDHPKNKDFDQNEKSVEEEQNMSTIQNNEEIVTKDKNTHMKDDSEEDPYKELISSNTTESETYVKHKDTTETIKDNAISPETKKNANQQKDVKSKIVYILNDEDIFDAKVSKIPEIANPPASSNTIKTENIFDDSDDDIFRAKGSKATEIARPIPTHTENIKTNSISVDPADIFDAKVSKVHEITKPRPTPTENIEPGGIFLDSHDSCDAKDGKKTDTSKPSPETTENIKTKTILDDSDNIVRKLPEIAKSSVAPTENMKSESAFDGPDDIFKTMANIENTKVEIKTLGQVYNEPVVKTQKLDFLSDSDDDNLFKPTKPTKEVIPVQKRVKTEENVQVVVKDVPLKSKSKTSLFDDTNDDLFKGKTKEVVKNEKKVSLFGSDSDEELFGGSKKEKVVPKKDEFKKEEIKREFKKGSLFDDDDDDDLFGASTKKKMVADSKPQSSKPTSSKEVFSQPSEPVFEDPLSLYGSDYEL